MSHLVPAGTKIEFTPDPGWDWVGFEGMLDLSARFDRMDHAGGMITVDLDLLDLAPQLIGKQYQANGFQDRPGSVLQAMLEIDRGTLCERATVAGQFVLHSSTTGTFRIQCVPAFKAGSPPVPDPAPIRQGTWRIQAPESPRTFC